MDFRPTVAGTGSFTTNASLVIAVWNGSIATQGAASTTSFHSSSAVGRWWHAVGIIDGTQFAIYINGRLERTATGSYGVLSSGQSLSIGNLAGTDHVFDGEMDDVRIYNRILSPQEIAALANSRRRNHSQ